MPAALKTQKEPAYVDYIGDYEKVMQDVVAACGGRQQANQMLAELREEYEKTNQDLKRIRRECGKNAERFAGEKVRLLTTAQDEVGRIIGKYAPGSADRVRELVFGTSLAMSAMMVPVTYAVSALSVATNIVSVGSNYKKMARGSGSATGGFTSGSRLPKISRMARKK